MSILDNLELYHTGIRIIDEFDRSPILSYEVVNTKEPPSFETKYLYHLRVIIGATCASDDQDMVDNAKEILLHRLYKDVLEYIYEIRHAIYKGKRNEALTLLRNLEKHLI